MARLTAAVRTTKILLFLSLLMQCSSLDVPQDATAGILEKVRELADLVSSLENKMTEVKNEMSEFIERVSTEDDNTLSLLSRNIQRDYLAKIAEVKQKVKEKILAIEAQVNETKREAKTPKLKCQMGWKLFEELCYYISTNELTWDSGRKECLHLDADYVKLNSEDEFSFLKSEFTGNVWIGLTDKDVEGIFRWTSDNTLHNLSNHRHWWHGGQPDNEHGGEDCVHFTSWDNGRTYKLNDAKCNQKYRFVCEMKADKIMV